LTSRPRHPLFSRVAEFCVARFSVDVLHGMTIARRLNGDRGEDTILASGAFSAEDLE
jgi:hypothetical protein